MIYMEIIPKMRKIKQLLSKPEQEEKERCMKLPEKIKKERCMLHNGGILLEELLHSCDGKYNSFQIFSSNELAKATNNYRQQLLMGHKWTTLHRGCFNGRQIIVTTFPNNVIDEPINEVVFGSQLNNHKNILVLLGCCLETETPILVHEYAENGALSDHIFKSSNNQQQQQQLLLNWDCRLKVVKEIADALAYLHTGLSRPIVHRDVKPSNIYLDGNYVAKLSDFGLSLSIPLGEEYVETDVAGSVGYSDPAYFRTSQVNEKCDVYSFGCLLIAILSGERILSLIKTTNPRRINRYEIFVKRVEATSSGQSSALGMEESKLRLHQFMIETAKKYMGPDITLEDQWKLSMAWTLASKCLKLAPDERPTMTQVAQEIRRIIKFQCNTPSIPIITVTNDDMSDFYEDVIGLTISTLH